MWVYLSHPWGPSCPAYAGGQRIELSRSRSIAKGDCANNMEFKASNHIGTHFDFPLHFDGNGKSAVGYNPQDFIFKKIALYWLEISPGKLVDISCLEKLPKPEDADLCLIRTGASLYRETDTYWQNGPGLACDLANWLRGHFKNLRAVGIDFISVSSFGARDIGRKVHKEFLCHERPLLIIEDADFSSLQNTIPTSVIALPLRIEDGDGAPCTIIAQINN